MISHASQGAEMGRTRLMPVVKVPGLTHGLARSLSAAWEQSDVVVSWGKDAETASRHPCLTLHELMADFAVEGAGPRSEDTEVPTDLPQGGAPGDASRAHGVDVEAVARKVLQDAVRLASMRPLFGLVLCGGQSRRMCRDKALLSYSDGVTQIERTVAMLSAFCELVLCSARAEQAQAYHDLCGAPVIADTIVDAGPLGGILSAMRAHPQAAWLVVAVDLPRLDGECLQQLVAERDPLRFATVYRSACAGYLEPLCAIYEPKFLPAGLAALGLGYLCPGRVLSSLRIREVHQLPSSPALVNVNTPAEYEHVRRDMLRGFASGEPLQ